MPEYVNDRTCPACGKPTLYSVTGATGQQWACTDPDCVYAHGIPVEAWLFHHPGVTTGRVHSVSIDNDGIGRIDNA
jgi:hypothetical protein